ncbi:MAG: TolC family protein [Gammaproteobacteria bacterium]|nr:TolC family protein [Gammaproteobacteria bacterium]
MTTPFLPRGSRAARLRNPLLITLTAMVFGGLSAGCATSGSTASVRKVNRQLADFTAENLALASDAELLRTRREGLDALLAAPLSQDAAVRVALLGSPALQALLASKSAAIASAARDGRIGNPALNYERVRHGSEIEIGRLLSVGLLELLTLPQRQRVASAAVEAAEIELAIAVIDEVTRVRQAWVRAVAAEQRQRYAASVLESAAASAELARRMEAAGNFNKMSRARQQAFEADARTQAVLARQQASGTREELVRALGLDDQNAKRLQLPERLPEIPQQPLAAEAVGARVNAERVDVKLAEAQWRAAAARRGLGKVTTLTDIELGLRRDPEARGYEIDVRLPIFDAGELDRRALDGATLAAAGNLEATLRAAGSHLRESYSAYLAAYDVARHHRDELVPLRKTIAEESLLRYNGMIIGVFELLADAREQITTVMAAIDAEQQFWLAEAALQSAFAGRPTGAVALDVAAARPAEAAGGH